MSESLCGVWVDDSGVVHLSVATADGLRVTRTETLRPFAWLNEQVSATTDGVAIEPLKGEGPFNRLAHAESLDTFDDFVKVAKETGGVDVVRPLESQFLLQKRRRLFRDLGFHELRRCQLDIETASSDGEFSDAVKADDRVLAIGLRFGERNRLLVLDEMSTEGEKRLLEQLNAVLLEEDPDVIEGHNIFKFELDYLRQRAKKAALARKRRFATVASRSPNAGLIFLAATCRDGPWSIRICSFSNTTSRRVNSRRMV